jgi:hypothetical protein
VTGYDDLLADVVSAIEDARRAAARSVNAVMTATYWLVGQRIVEREQEGAARARYREALLERLSADLTRQFGRGFSVRNLRQMRAFYMAWPNRQTLSADSEIVDPAKVDGAPASQQTAEALIAQRCPQNGEISRHPRHGPRQRAAPRRAGLRRERSEARRGPPAGLARAARTGRGAHRSFEHSPSPGRGPGARCEAE